MSAPGRVAVLGEVLADLVADPDGRWVLHPGGSPANTAVGLARLQVPTLLLGRLARGPVGDRLRRHLVGNGVDLSHAVPAEEPASLAFVELDEAGAARYAFYVGGTADFAWRPAELAARPPDLVAWHTGSLASWLEPGWQVVAEATARAAADPGVTVSLDPNLRPALLADRPVARRRVGELLGSADLVKVSEEDLDWLHPGRPAEEVARDWLAGGPALVVVTLGPRGALAVCADRPAVQVPGQHVQVVDTVGAGDSFTSALLASLYRRGVLGPGFRGALPGLDLPAVVAEAVRASALTCTRPGADPPWPAELSAP